MPEFAGFVYDDAGVAINGATANLYDRNTTTPVRATTTTNSSGYFSISHATEGRFDVEFVNGTSKRRVKYDDARQFQEVEVSNLLVRNPASTFVYDIVPAAITANRQLTLPLLTGTATVVCTPTVANIAFGVGVAMVAGDYAIGRDADGTNQLHLNVPTGASFEWSEQDVSRMVLSGGGLLFINDTANAQMTLGLTINQGANDNEILALKSSDVAHGLTSFTETDTYLSIGKNDGPAGGAYLIAVAEDTVGVARSFRLDAVGGLPDTVPSTTATALGLMYFAEHDGANARAASAANALIFAVATGATITNKFIVDAEGDLHVDGATTLTAFDQWDDVALARAFDQFRAPDQVVRDEWDDFVKYGRRELVEAGVLSDPHDGGRPMVNITQLQRLHNGAIWQLGKRLMMQQREIETLRQQMALKGG